MTPSMHQALFVSVLGALAASAFAQAPTDAQRAAIRRASPVALVRRPLLPLPADPHVLPGA
jgi:hypothetical protein